MSCISSGEKLFQRWGHGFVNIFLKFMMTGENIICNSTLLGKINNTVSLVEQPDFLNLN